jgi:hypothetical protein
MATTSEVIEGSGAHIAEFARDGNKVESGVGIAFSGGGFRAMLFYAGALMRLNELGCYPKLGGFQVCPAGRLLWDVWRRYGPNWHHPGVFARTQGHIIPHLNNAWKVLQFPQLLLPGDRPDLFSLEK